MKVQYFFVKTPSGEYLTGACDDLGRSVTSPDEAYAWSYTKQAADILIGGDERLKGSQLVPV